MLSRSFSGDPIMALSALRTAIRLRLPILGLLLLVALPLQARCDDSNAAAPAAATHEASLGRSVVRGATYKSVTFLFNVATYSFFTGSGVEGTAISVFLSSYTYLTYVSADYALDHLYPRSADNKSAPEVIAESAERTTYKFVLYKLLNAPVALTAAYYATGTAMGAVAFYSGMSLIKGGLFYANNLLWDSYEAAWGTASVAKPSP